MSKEKEEKCNCRVCQRNAKFYEFDEQLKNANLGDAANFMKDLLDDASHAEEDRDYYHSILDGSWAEADNIIAHIRSKKATKSLKNLCDDEFVDSLLNTNFIDRLLEKVGNRMHEEHSKT